jgi:N-acetylneuraminate synthase
MKAMADRVYIIAEAGVNHNGSPERAGQMIDAAVEAGADAVKFQSFRTEALVSRRAAKADYQLRTTDSRESQYDMLKKLELDESAHEALIQRCRQRGIDFLSTPFDLASMEMLVKRFGLPRVKISSGDVDNAPLLLAAARAQTPVILSTGMCTLADVEAALAILAFGYLPGNRAPSRREFQRAFNLPETPALLKDKVVLLHATTEYPAPLADVHLRAMDTLRAAFGLPVGYSDHTAGIAVPIAAVARGAMVIEKHFTLDRSLPGPDHQASLEPGELKEMVAAIRQVETALGTDRKTFSPAEGKNREAARKSLVALKEIAPGESFTEANLTVKRPGTGLSPLCYWDWLGKTAGRTYAADEEIEP